MNEKTKALRLADALDAVNTNNADSLLVQMTARSAATELRRLVAENEALQSQIGQQKPLLQRIAELERKSDQDDETIIWQAKEISDKIDRIAELELLLEEARSGNS